jgi:tRNA dimethylallyltransferase
VTEVAPGRPDLPLIAIFGPTAVGKTAVAIELAQLIAGRGGAAVAVNCDSIQVYRGLETISGAADATQQRLLEHRLLSFLPVDQEYSAGRYSKLAHSEIDDLIASGKTPLLVGGTGLYLRGALTDMAFRPPVPEGVRAAVQADIETRGATVVHGELPVQIRDRIHANDRSRIARAAELLATGQEPAPDHRGGGELWTAGLRRRSVLIGLAEEPEVLRRRIEARVEQMASAGAGREAELAVEAGASRTARAAIGFREFLQGDKEQAASRHWQYARRQLTWMRRMEGVETLERGGRDDRELADSILELAEAASAGNAGISTSG